MWNHHLDYHWSDHLFSPSTSRTRDIQVVHIINRCPKTEPKDPTKHRWTLNFGGLCFSYLCKGSQLDARKLRLPEIKGNLKDQPWKMRSQTNNRICTWMSMVFSFTPIYIGWTRPVSRWNNLFTNHLLTSWDIQVHLHKTNMDFENTKPKHPIFQDWCPSHLNFPQI